MTDNKLSAQEAAEAIEMLAKSGLTLEQVAEIERAMTDERMGRLKQAFENMEQATEQLREKMETALGTSLKAVQLAKEARTDDNDAA